MKTLFLGSYGYGNLGDELCLIEAIQHFGPSEVWAYSFDPAFTRRTTGVANLISERSQVVGLEPEQIVLGGGGVGFWPSFRDNLHWMGDASAVSADTRLHIHNIGVATIRAPQWFTDQIVRSVLGQLTSFSVRDHVSNWLVREWGFGLRPKISLYPERSLPQEPFPLRDFGAKRAVGFSITGRASMLTALHANRDLIRRFIAELGVFTAVPIVSTVHNDNPEEDDIHGFEIFAELFLKGRSIALPEMLSREWWNAEMTPLRLKYVIGKLDLLVSHRKHNIIHAIGTKTRFVGIFPSDDDSIARVIFSLRHLLPMGSSVLALQV